jgi:hypothetical protein
MGNAEGVFTHFARMYFKRLESGKFSRVPEGDDGGTMTLSAEELNILIPGARLEKKLKRREEVDRILV